MRNKPCVQVLSCHDENTLRANPVFGRAHLHVDTLQVEHPANLDVIVVMVDMVDTSGTPCT